MRHYVCGFLFNMSGLPSVALIRKERPAWQKGLYNGIGGKVEVGETPHSAIHREFWEETGAHIGHWKPFCTLLHSVEASKSSPAGPWMVHFFKAFQVATLQSPTDEQVRWWEVQSVANRLNNYFVPNLH